MKNFVIPACLTIAGSDSGGGAGIQADLKTFNFFEVFGSTAITAVTAQNPCEVASIYPLPPSSVISQFRSVMDRISIKAIKTGMLFSSEIIDSLAGEIILLPQDIPLIVDPVTVATSGARLTKDHCKNAYEKGIFPKATLITPNIPEAEFFLGAKISNSKEMIESAKELSRRYQTSLLLKGGHLSGKFALDVAVIDSKVYEITTPFVESPTSHGTGCTLSSAISANLALGKNLLESIHTAKAFIYESLNCCREIGKGIYTLGQPKKLDLPIVKIVASDS